LEETEDSLYWTEDDENLGGDSVDNAKEGEKWAKSKQTNKRVGKNSIFTSGLSKKSNPRCKRKNSLE